MPDLKTVIEAGVLLVSLTATFVGLQWRVNALKEKVDSEAEETGDRMAAMEKAMGAIGAKLDDARTRLTGAERDISHQDGALARIEGAITTATARLEVQIGALQSRIDEALARRKDG